MQQDRDPNWQFVLHDDPSERKHTTDLQKTKEQRRCGTQIYFLAPLVQISEFLRSAEDIHSFVSGSRDLRSSRPAGVLLSFGGIRSWVNCLERIGLKAQRKN